MPQFLRDKESRRYVLQFSAWCPLGMASLGVVPQVGIAGNRERLV
jgi:hypothetical protein